MTETNVPRPNPYRVDAPIHKVQTLDSNGDDRYLFRHDFSRLDATNVDLLLKREKETKRITEKLTKGRSRTKFKSIDADRGFYCSLINGGGWRPYGLEPKREKALIPPSAEEFYIQNTETGVWEPGWKELDKATMLTLTPEKMSEAIDNWLSCKGKSIGSGSIDFMFEKGGLMKIGLAIGDPDSPAYNLLFELRRPDSKRRTKFKEDFAYAIDNSKGDMGNIETVIDLRQGIGLFDEYFATCPSDPAYSEILFADARERGNGHKPGQPAPEELKIEKEFSVRPYTDELRDDLVTYLNPHFKVEIAAAAVATFSKTDQE